MDFHACGGGCRTLDRYTRAPSGFRTACDQRTIWRDGCRSEENEEGGVRKSTANVESKRRSLTETARPRESALSSAGIHRAHGMQAGAIATRRRAVDV